jgi:hypothetical protein
MILLVAAVCMHAAESCTHATVTVLLSHITHSLHAAQHAQDTACSLLTALIGILLSTVAAGANTAVAAAAAASAAAAVLAVAGGVVNTTMLSLAALNSVNNHIIALLATAAKCEHWLLLQCSC